MAAGLDVEPGERLGAAESKARWQRLRQQNAQILAERAELTRKLRAERAELAEQQRQLAAAERKRKAKNAR